MSSTQITYAVRSKRFIQIWMFLKIKITALINLCWGHVLGGVSITLPSLKKYIKKNFPKKSSFPGIEPGPPGPMASMLTTELSRLWITFGRNTVRFNKKHIYLQTAVSHDMSSECRFAWNETRWRHDVYKSGNETCFRINCLLAEVTHVLLWSNRYDRVDKYPLYWIPGNGLIVARAFWCTIPGGVVDFSLFHEAYLSDPTHTNRRYKKWVKGQRISDYPWTWARFKTGGA